jgi:hypothetical protein
MKECREEGSVLQRLFLSSLGLQPETNGVTSDIKYDAIHVLSIGDRGREELIYIRHSLNFTRENLNERITVLKQYRSREGTQRTEIIYISKSIDSLGDLLADCEIQRDRVEMICNGVGVSRFLTKRLFS